MSSSLFLILLQILFANQRILLFAYLFYPISIFLFSIKNSIYIRSLFV
jgi:hypothetical protein